MLQDNTIQVDRDLDYYSYEYEYPNGMDLKPKSDFHDDLLKRVMDRATESMRFIQQRHGAWQDIDDTLTAYIPLSETEKLLKTKDSRVPVSVVIPVSYAFLDTLLTNLIATFLTDPIFKYEGVGPEDTMGAILLEKVIAVHTVKRQIGLAIHTALRDALAYGIGIVHPTWVIEDGKKTVLREQSFYSRYMTGNVGTGVMERESVPTVLFEGNDLLNVNPYYYLPDPNAPVHKVQSSEYTGWIDVDNRMSLLDKESTSGGDIFNCRYTKHIDGKSHLIKSLAPDNISRLTNRVDVLYMYIHLIPEEWKLGKGTYPEWWFFGIAGDQIIITAKPLGLDHGKVPEIRCAPNYDGYGASPISNIEMTFGMQGQVDWLLNSHMENVRRSIANKTIVDPSMVNMHDVESNQAGGIWRLRKSAWGRGIEQAVKQFPITDVTQQHVVDAGNMIGIMKEVVGTSNPLMGTQRKTSERVSAQEARDTKLGALSRIEKIARICGMQFMYNIGDMFAAHTQQLMSEDMYVKVIGRWEDVLRAEYGDMISNNRMKVSPIDIMVAYDVIAGDGSVMSGDNADTWVNLYGILAKSPEIAMQFDMVRIFKHIARLLGAKNINEFVMQGGAVAPTVMPNEQVAGQAQAGNIIPLRQAVGPGE